MKRTIEERLRVLEVRKKAIQAKWTLEQRLERDLTEHQPESRQPIKVDRALLSSIDHDLELDAQWMIDSLYDAKLNPFPLPMHESALRRCYQHPLIGYPFPFDWT